MKFKIIADLFENLEKTSKRLDKIQILRNFVVENGIKDSAVIFDIISWNFQRKINKKTLGISLKTIFSVLSFLSKLNESEVEKRFNKLGDVGKLAIELLTKTQQKSLFISDLTLIGIVKTFEEISSISGNNSQKVKKEILSKLFLSAKNENEYKFLARLFIDDLRIGVSEGVLKEASINFFLPKFLGLNFYCSSCDYFTFSSNKCLKCQKIIDDKNQEELISKNYELVEIDTPKEEIGLEKFIGEKQEIEKFKFILRLDEKKFVVKSENPRYFYNSFLHFFEIKYNLLNSFSKIFNILKEDKLDLLNAKIILKNPIRSMLGTRVLNVDDAFAISGFPGFIDYKYDGLRVQIHNDYGDVRLFSRNLDNITKQFPEVVEYIRINFSDISFVIDSECVGFDFGKGKFLDFQILSKRIMTKNYDEVSYINVVIKAFDLMYMNGETLIGKVYAERREMLDNLFLNRPLKQKINFDISKLRKPNFSN